MEDTSGWSIDADLGFAPLAELGWHCEWLPWRAPDIDWDQWDAVYLAAPWDYPDDPAGFLAVLEAIDRSRSVLVNDLELVRWNVPKTYLRDLEARGAAIVPSLWFDRLEESMLEAFFAAYDHRKIIIKPVISTNAAHTYLLEQPVDRGTLDLLLQTFADRPFIVQPFIGNIQSEGEFSLFYIGGSCSHAIRKVPKPADFRVQEEHGALIEAVVPEPLLLRTADEVMALIDPAPVYARCDFVRDAEGIFRVMEVELIEPSLYLRMDDMAPSRFAAAFDRYVSNRTGE